MLLAAPLSAQTNQPPPAETGPGAGADQCFGFCCVIDGRLICNPEGGSQPVSPLGPVIMEGDGILDVETIREQLELQEGDLR